VLVHTGQVVVVCPDEYFVSLPTNGSAAITVRASNVTLQLHEVGIQPLPARQFEGWGVHAQDVDGLRLAGGRIAGFRAAVVVTGGSGHEIRNAALSHNRLRRVLGTPADFLSVWPDFEGQLAVDSIGDGVVFIGVKDSTVQGVNATGQQNGIGCFGCTRVKIIGNNCSNNEGWGIHMRRSSFNLVAHNFADHCHPTRSQYCRTAQNNGCDSASLLLIKDSNDNLVANNSLTDGGDGVFSAAMGPSDEGCPPRPTPCPNCCHWGTDRNTYSHNDVRFARALCLESTFAFDNVFRSNLATNCSIAAAWLGYSVNASLIDNDLSDSPTGVSDQSAVNITLVGNRILRNGVGVLANTGTFPPTAVFTGASGGYRLSGNVIANSTGVGLDFLDTGNVVMQGNTIADNRGGNLRFRVAETLALEGPLELQNNTILAGEAVFNLQNLQSTLIDARRNWWGITDEAAIEHTLIGAEQMAVLPPNKVAVLDIEFSRSLNSGTSLTIKRPVNSRMDDAMDCSHRSNLSGNGQPLLPIVPGCVIGLRFRDIYVPADALVTGMRLHLPLSRGVAAEGMFTVQIEASDDARAFDTVTDLPSKRLAGDGKVVWNLSTNRTAAGVASPDLSALLRDLLQKQSASWHPGNALSVLLRPEMATPQAAPLGNVIAFDKEGYSLDPASDVPTEWRHFRKHRFAQLMINYSTSAASTMVVEAELMSEDDNADTSAADQNINFGWQGQHGSNPERGGFIFRNISLPVESPGFDLSGVQLVLPTDGPYVPDLSLCVQAEAAWPPEPYSSTSLPAQRRLLPVVVPWLLHNQTWQFTEWHRSPDLSPLLAASIEKGAWASGSSSGIGFQIIPCVNENIPIPAEATTRRVWGFGRDPRRTQHDFVDAGPTPFVPVLGTPP
jgi:parallel beta-helix repeat protein